MKRLVLTAAILMAAIALAIAQGQDKSKRPSPPRTAEGSIDGVKIKIDYSAPSAKGRKMLGGNEPYGKVWRTGANEATVFEIDKPVQVEGQALAAASMNFLLYQVSLNGPSFSKSSGNNGAPTTTRKLKMYCGSRSRQERHHLLSRHSRSV